MNYQNLIKFVASVKMADKSNARFISDVLLKDGGKGSGNFGHQGRIGKRGGSAKVHGSVSFKSLKEDYDKLNKSPYSWNDRVRVYKSLLGMRNWYKNEAGGSEYTDNAPLVEQDYQYLLHKVSNALNRQSNAESIDQIDNEDDYFQSKKDALSMLTKLALPDTGMPDCIQMRTIYQYQSDLDMAKEKFWKQQQKKAREKAEQNEQQFDEKYWDYGIQFDQDKFKKQWLQKPPVKPFDAYLNGKIVQFSKEQAQALARLAWDDSDDLGSTMEAMYEDPDVFDHCVSALKKVFPLPQPQTEEEQKRTEQQFVDRATSKQYQQRQFEQNERLRTQKTPAQYKKSLATAKADLGKTTSSTRQAVGKCSTSQDVMEELRKSGLFRNVQRGIIKDVDVAKGMANAMMDNIQRMPFLAGYIQRLEADQRIRNELENAYAYCSGRRICPSLLKRKDNEWLEKQWQQDADTKFHTLTDMTPSQTIFTHEIGHSVMSALQDAGEDVQNGILQKALLSIGHKTQISRYDKKTFEQQQRIKESLSEYANKNTAELFAQLYTQAYCSKKPRTFAMAFRKLLEQSVERNKSKLEALS